MRAGSEADNLKKWLCAMLCAAMLAALCACDGTPFAQAEQPKKNIRIGVSVYDGYDTFVGELMKYFATFARETEQAEKVSIDIVQESAGGIQATQNAQVERFIETGCDVICVNLVDRAESSVIIEKVKTAGIPAVFFNRELVEEDLERWDRLYYVGAPALQSGMLQGELVTDACRADFDGVDKNGDGVLQYVMLEGEAGHQDAIVRTESSVKTVQAAGFKLERLSSEIANWNRAQAETKMSGWLAAFGDEIEVVFANNDEMALGAVEALKNNDVPRGKWPLVVGIDGTSYGVAAVREGELYGTVLNDAAGQAQAMLDLAFSLSTTGAPPPDMELAGGKYIRLPYKKITQDSLDAQA